MDKILYLRTVDAKHRSYGGFQWPREVGAEVVAPDWNPATVCGGGLHGLPWGEGDSGLLSCSSHAVWQVVSASGGIDLGGKHKFERCTLLFSGAREAAIAYLMANGAAGRAICYATATAGDSGTATVGRGGIATVGRGGIATAGDDGTATAGERGTATAGERGTATAGYYGTATAARQGTAKAGDFGTATAGDGGTATAGDDGTLQIWWHDGGRRRVATGYVGENGILPSVPYKVSNGKLVRAEK